MTLSDFMTGKILAFKKLELSVRDISKYQRVSSSSVQEIIKDSDKTIPCFSKL